MKLLSNFDHLKKNILVKILGANNDRLDFLVDSFYQFSDNKQKITIGFGIFGFILFLILIFYLYFAGINSLQSQLYESISAHKELQHLAINYKKEKTRYQSLITNLDNKSNNLTSLKPYFEQVARNQELNLGSLNEKVFPIQDNYLLSEKLDEIRIDVAINNISLPKLLKYITTLERSRNHLSVTHLSIKSRYETKLYFDTKISVRGYRVK